MLLLNVISFAKADVILEIRFSRADISFWKVQVNCVRFRHLV